MQDNSTLNRLFYGNIEFGRLIIQSPQYDEARSVLLALQKQVYGTITGEPAKLLEKYDEAETNLQSIALSESFKAGFSLA